ncbi:xanthine phosphoribosyltransferase [Prevotella sp. khp7]|jgi:xanthine phosphoribosyltransferase|uniref:xanthine phosphoribosyltransferase n=1 Tax=Prevotella sp. khp7 TaxID=1761885 RepID=UPI0008CAB922|nr:xanthine phosphoribosyltransferase [Prevotella sp. khp7]SEV82446.1 xanthine phosphoribosyltransferase [Prevotella sp. khp7]
MNFLEEKILCDGVIKQGNILKIDNFLNHQIDIDIMRQMAYELKRRFRGVEVNKVLTIEASGIAIATMLGDLYDVPVVFAKKSETANSTDDKYVSNAYSFTHKKMNQVFVSRPYLHATDKVLIVDDFLADGQAVHALIDLVHQAGGEVMGIGIAVEKGQQMGGSTLRDEGYHLESIAIIEEMDWETQTIRFREQPLREIEQTQLKLKQ